MWGHSKSGWGVHGSSAVSYGGFFESNSAAQIHLKPAASFGPPTGPHGMGDFFVDKTGALFYCYGDNNWEKLAGPSLASRGLISAVINRLRGIFGP